jgi:tRNA nucleotidyltransferase/poly(A) polymerase
VLNENIFASVELDASRRDFTVGALFYNLHTGEVEDYVGGLSDLGLDEEGLPRLRILLRTPLPAAETFLADPLRILRGLKFAARFEALVDEDIVAAMYQGSVRESFRNKLTPERIAAELLGQWEDENGVREYKRGIFNSANAPHKAITPLDDCGLLDVILDIPRMRRGWREFHMHQKSKYHAFDVYSHTLQVMFQLVNHPFWVALNESNPERAALLLFAALLHDLGKRDPTKCQEKDDGTCSYHGHEESSAQAARDICNKLKMSNEATTYVVEVVEYHMDPHGTDWGNKDKTLRKFMSRHPDCWEDIIVHAYCDCMASGTPRTDEEIGTYDVNRDRCHWLLENDAVAPTTTKPALGGEIIMGLFPTLKQGPWIKATVNRLNEVRFERPEVSEDELIALVKEWRESILADPQYAKYHKESVAPATT